jgi:hypothetical protein
MIIIPKEQPVIKNLNSYYLHTRKFIEHFQGELGSGGIHFHAPAVEAVVYFDKDDLLNGTFRDKDGQIKGKQAIERIIDTAATINFNIDVYAIELDKVYFWANIPDAEELYKDLSTEFTDLNGLIKKMQSEKLTGYIEVALSGGGDGGLIFFINGEIIGGSYSWVQGQVNGSRETLESLIEKTKASGGTFHVSRISLSKGDEPQTLSESSEISVSGDVLAAVEELLTIFERIVRSNKKIKADFNTVLRKKCVDMADRYMCLDPFAAEFEYTNQKVKYAGTEGLDQLLEGVLNTVKEIADDLDIADEVRDELLTPWSEKYRLDLERLGIQV